MITFCKYFLRILSESIFTVEADQRQPDNHFRKYSLEVDTSCNIVDTSHNSVHIQTLKSTNVNQEQRKCFIVLNKILSRELHEREPFAKVFSQSSHPAEPLLDGNAAPSWFIRESREKAAK